MQSHIFLNSQTIIIFPYLFLIYQSNFFFCKKIQEDLSKPLSVTWLEVEWKREQLEQSIAEVSEIVKMKERPFRTEDYFLKLRPVWYHESTDSSFIEFPFQLAIDTKSENIFVVDYKTNKIHTGHHLYHIPIPPGPVGLCFSQQISNCV